MCSYPTGDVTLSITNHYARNCQLFDGEYIGGCAKRADIQAKLKLGPLLTTMYMPNTMKDFMGTGVWINNSNYMVNGLGQNHAVLVVGWISDTTLGSGC